MTHFKEGDKVRLNCQYGTCDEGDVGEVIGVTNAHYTPERYLEVQMPGKGYSITGYDWRFDLVNEDNSDAEFKTLDRAVEWLRGSGIPYGVTDLLMLAEWLDKQS